jgi:hypothetical protein
MQQAYPTLNDYAPSWADLTCTLSVHGGGPILSIWDIAALKFASTVEVGEQRGTSGGIVMKRTTGSLKDEASATFYRSGLRKLLEGLRTVAPLRGAQRRVSLVAFDMVLHHSPPGEPDIYIHKILGCRLLGFSSDMAEGPEADKVELALHPMQNVQVIGGEDVVLI